MDNVKDKREYTLVPALAALGIIFGVLAKAGDVAIQGSFFGNILSSFGMVSSRLFIWAVICTAIAILSPNKIWSAVNVFLFLVTMLLAYYLYSHFIVEYLVWRVVKFWLIMLIPSMISAFIVWHIKTIRILKYVVIVLGTAIMIFDMVKEAILIAMAIDVILYAVFLYLVLSKRRP